MRSQIEMFHEIYLFSHSWISPSCRWSWFRLILSRKVREKLRSDSRRQFNRDGVPELSHCFRPRPLEKPIVGERLQTSALSHREIPDRDIIEAKSVLASRHTVVTSLERLCWLIPSAAIVSRVCLRSGIQEVIQCLGGSLTHANARQVSDRVPHRKPGASKLIESTQGQLLYASS